MFKISLDANVIIDLCYRTYPIHLFPQLWAELDLFFKGAYGLYLCETIYDEVENYIYNHNVDKVVIDDFISKFNVSIVSRNDIGNQILAIQRKLLEYPASEKSNHVKATDSVPDIHLIALASYLGSNVLVLTSEQGVPNFDWNSSNAAKQSGGLKIPNICEKLGIQCMSWVKFFEHVGLNLKS